MTKKDRKVFSSNFHILFRFKLSFFNKYKTFIKMYYPCLRSQNSGLLYDIAILLCFCILPINFISKLSASSCSFMLDAECNLYISCWVNGRINLSKFEFASIWCASIPLKAECPLNSSPMEKNINVRQVSCVTSILYIVFDRDFLCSFLQ